MNIGNINKLILTDKKSENEFLYFYSFSVMPHSKIKEKNFLLNNIFKENV